MANDNNRTKTYRRNSLAALIALGVLAADRAAKIWSAGTLSRMPTMPVIPGVLNFTYAENRGAAFSILSGQRWFLVVVSLAVLGVLLAVFFTRFFDHKLMDIALPMLVGGALGNLIDRVVQGYVVDFIDVQLFRFAVFNIADCAITVGAALMIVYVLFIGQDDFLGKTPDGGGGRA